MSRSVRTVIGLLLAAAATSPVHAQQAGASGQVEADTSAILRREVFVYPGGGRRDPFVPLTAGEGLGPRFDDLELTGVIYSPSAGSVAVLVDRATLKRYRAREGDSLGDARLLAIRETEVDFLVSGFGVSRRETLRVKKQEQEPG
ncbi:MAG: hypothetical protein ACE5JR_08355 [Gemmatimonadota bacterium]